MVQLVIDVICKRRDHFQFEYKKDAIKSCAGMSEITRKRPLDEKESDQRGTKIAKKDEPSDEASVAEMKKEEEEEEGKVSEVGKVDENKNLSNVNSVDSEEPTTSIEETCDPGAIQKDEVDEEKENSNSNKEEGKVKTNSGDGETPKKTGFVFGSTTTFGKMGGFKMVGNFSMKNKSEKSDVVDGKSDNNEEAKNEEDQPKEREEALDNKENETNKNTAKKPVFGSGATFGNAFQMAINKKSVFDELQSKSELKNQETGNPSVEGKADVYQKVQLEKQDVKSGEENEENIFQIKAKLYHMELSKSSLGWRERGFGVIKVNKFIESPSEKYNSRVVMRSNGNLKLILNVPIVKGLNVLKGLPSSLHGNKFIRLQMIEEGEPVQYAIKVGQAENAEKLFEFIQGQIPK